MWDFSRLPKDKHSVLIDHWNDKQYDDIARMVKAYGVYTQCLTCTGMGASKIDEWMEYGISEGKLNID